MKLFKLHVKNTPVFRQQQTFVAMTNLHEPTPIARPNICCPTYLPWDSLEFVELDRGKVTKPILNFKEDTTSFQRKLKNFFFDSLAKNELC